MYRMLWWCSDALMICPLSSATYDRPVVGVCMHIGPWWSISALNMYTTSAQPVHYGELRSSRCKCSQFKLHSSSCTEAWGAGRSADVSIMFTRPDPCKFAALVATHCARVCKWFRAYPRLSTYPTIHLSKTIHSLDPARPRKCTTER